MTRRDNIYHPPISFHPDIYPMTELFFRVAEADFSVRHLDDDDLRHLLPSYAPFQIKAQPDESLMFGMTVGKGLVPFEGEGEELGQFDCGGICHGVYARPEGGYLILISNVGDVPACAMRTTARFDRIEVSLYGDDACRTFGLGNALMIAYAFSGAFHHILLIHASVTMAHGGGHLFLGKSGTGKSTHSRQWLTYLPDTELLNDDNPAVRFHPESNRVIVYGTPWSGKTPCYKNKSVPVRAIVRLQQHPQNEICREATLPAFASLLSSCSTMVWDKPTYRCICDTVGEVVRRAPVFYLKCKPDREAAEICSAAVDQAYQQ